MFARALVSRSPLIATPVLPVVAASTPLASSLLRANMWTSAAHQNRYVAMDTLLEAKKAKGVTFAELSKHVGKDEVFVASLFYGQNRADPSDISALAKALDVSESKISVLATEFPDKG
ncbi:Cyanate hydratase [Gonapodya sp. JEL0774]|nr:Cyanate hydratase [Gonapodya sp. JEL0774]